MARTKANKLYRTFVKGLVTEASPLTYPEDTSYDELNTILSRKGSRTRRLGQAYLHSSISGEALVSDWEISQTEHVWKAVGKNPNLNFLVVQKGLMVYFYDLKYSTAIERKKAFSLDLSPYARPGASLNDLAKNVFQMSAGKGFLYIVGKDLEPIYIEYKKDTDTIEVFKITILVRDYDNLRDNLANDEEPATLSKEHHYNLINQGWLYGSSSTTTYSPVTYDGYTVSPDFEFFYPWAAILGESTGIAYQVSSPTSSPIFKYHEVIGRYPGNNKQWWVAKAAADDKDKDIKEGDFLPELLNKIYSGNNRAPNGHFILNAFHKDRSKVSGVSNIPVDALDYRPEAVTFFSGRAWYGAGSYVYFSQILDTTGGDKSGLCYQEADPTAEDISDLIASDGGMVPIPEIDRIVRLVPLANGVLVFAQNGVWFISGGDAAFAATGLSVDKVSSIGTKSPMAIFEVDNKIFWWSDVGIQAIEQASGAFGAIPGKFGNTNISEQTIQTLYNQIPESGKRLSKACYDHLNNRIMWLYNDSETFVEDFQYNKCLLFDLTLQAFFLWEFGYIANGPIVTGFYLSTSEIENSGEINVIGLGDLVVTQTNEAVVTEGMVTTYGPQNIEYLVNVPGKGMAISKTDDASFADWTQFDNVGIGYESFIETGYELMEDTMRKKQAIYVFTHFRQEEDSSCKMFAKWDWASASNSNRWSTEFEAYRERTRPTPTTADREAFAVVTTKNKIRGGGKAVQFRFGTNEIGKNFELLGWSVAYAGNTEV